MSTSDAKNETERERRTLLAAGAASLPQLMLEGPQALLSDLDESCPKPDRGPNADHFPNVVVTSHDKQQALFYDDLLRDRTVMVNCFSIAHDRHYPITANLAVVQDHLGERLGRDIFMYSLTTDPVNDTPEALARFAHQHGARRGWLFLTGRLEDMELLRGRLFVHGRGVQADFTRDCSQGLVRYGNESIGLWGAVPSKSDPEWMARRLDWVTPKPSPTGAPKRRGPIPGTPFPGAVVEPA